MSKKVSAKIRCPSCGNTFNAQLYRTIWIEDPKNRELIFGDNINAVTCPSCKKTTRLEFPFLCTNVRKKLAVWHEPYHDAEIDKDIGRYKEKMGENSFFARAPRIKDWDNFKETIIAHENLDKSNTPPDASEDTATPSLVSPQPELFVRKFKHYWHSRKNFRLWSFGSVFWIIGVYLYVLIVEPYGSYMDDDEYFHMFLVMLIPPIFIGSAKYVYEKFVK